MSPAPLRTRKMASYKKTFLEESDEQ
jgi:hypothetical protein